MLNVGVHKNGFSFPKEEEHDNGNDEKDFIFMKMGVDDDPPWGQ